MKKVKSDTRLREKPAIYRSIESGGYFSESEIDRRIRFISSTVTRRALATVISLYFKKFITLGQVAYLLPFGRQIYNHACKVIGSIDCFNSYFCLEMGTEYNCAPVRFVERNFHYYSVFCRNAFKISANYEKKNSGTI